MWKSYTFQKSHFPDQAYLCIVKKAKLEISGSHRMEMGKGGGLGASPPTQNPKNFKESKLPKGLSAMVSYVNKT